MRGHLKAVLFVHGDNDVARTHQELVFRSWLQSRNYVFDREMRHGVAGDYGFGWHNREFCRVEGGTGGSAAAPHPDAPPPCVARNRPHRSEVFSQALCNLINALSSQKYIDRISEHLRSIFDVFSVRGSWVVAG